jgi:hypothetical protein
VLDDLDAIHPPIALLARLELVSVVFNPEAGPPPALGVAERVFSVDELGEPPEVSASALPVFAVYAEPRRTHDATA